MNKLAIADVHAHVPSVWTGLKENQIPRLQTVLRHLHAAMDLFARRARQIKVRRIAEQMLHQRGAVHAPMCGPAPLIVGAFPLLVLIKDPGTQWSCFLVQQRGFCRRKGKLAVH